MNNNIYVVAGAGALMVLLGFILYNYSSTSVALIATSTSTPSNATNTQQIEKVPAAPAVVTNPNVSPTDTTAIATGAVIPNGSFTNYWFEYGTTENMGSKTTNQSIGSSFTSITAPGYITALTKNTKYFYKLVAENQYGRVAGAQSSFTTTQGNPPPVGGLPLSRTIAASSITRTSATLNGIVNPNRATTQYWFEYGTTASLGNTSNFIVAGENNGDTNTTLPLSNLSPNTTYYFRLNSQNQFGTVNGNILTFKTSNANSPIPIISTKNPTSVNKNSATLRANVNPNGGDTNYWFEYSTDSKLGQNQLQTTSQIKLLAGKNSIGVSTDISNLATNTTYYYRVNAQNNEGLVHGSITSFKTNR